MAMNKPETEKRNPNLKLLWLAGLILVVLALGAVYLIQAAAPADELPLEISVKAALQQRDEGAFMLDVRQPEEWKEAHIPGALLIPLDELELHLDKIPTDKNVIVVCRSGNRSAAGRDLLLDAGFSNITSMGGGMNEWLAKGYPSTSGP